LFGHAKASELYDEINTIEGGMFRRFFLQSFFGFGFLLLGFGHFSVWVSKVARGLRAVFDESDERGREFNNDWL